MTRTRVKTTCISKKECEYSADKNRTEIELAVPYDLDSVYHRLSGGTNIVLSTINQDAADMFKIKGEYMITIQPFDESMESTENAGAGD